MIRPAALVDVGELQFFDRVGDLVQVMRGKMQIPRCYFQILMTEQKLDGAQIGAGFQQMGCPAVANQMGRHCLADAGLLAASEQMRHTVLSVIGCSESRSVREGNRYVSGLSHRQ